MALARLDHITGVKHGEACHVTVYIIYVAAVGVVHNYIDVLLVAAAFHQPLLLHVCGGQRHAAAVGSLQLCTVDLQCYAACVT